MVKVRVVREVKVVKGVKSGQPRIPDTRDQDIATYLRSRVAGSTGFGGNLLIGVWNRPHVPGRTLCHPRMTNEVLTSPAIVTK